MVDVSLCVWLQDGDTEDFEYTYAPTKINGTDHFVSSSDGVFMLRARAKVKARAM